MIRFRLFTLASSVALFTLPCIGVRAQALDDRLPATPPILIQAMTTYREAHMAQIFQPFRQLAGPDQVLTQTKIDQEDARLAAQRRASTMSRFFAADINGDDQLSGDEMAPQPINPNLIIELPATRQPNQPPKSPFASWDSNGDGVVTLEEALAFSKSQPRLNPLLSGGSRGQSLLDLDPNKDGKLTASELEQVALAAFANYDLDGDGALSPQEMTKMRRDQTAMMANSMMASRVMACNFPKISAAEKLYVVDAYDSQTLSSVSVNGQDDETLTAEIRIEDGSEPIYLVANSYSNMIWRLTGHTERVAHFVASAFHGVGVSGISKDKVTLHGGVECLPDFGEVQAVGRRAIQGIATAFGKPIDGLFQAYKVGAVSVPSDTTSPDTWDPKFPPRRGNVPFSFGAMTPAQVDGLNAQRTVASFKRFRVGGTISIDPTSVIGSGKVEAYQVMPQEAGLLQLIADGSLRERNPSEGYVVQKPIARFPAGLAGSHAVTFYLAPGVPRPAGDPGHSRVMALPQ